MTTKTKTAKTRSPYRFPARSRADMVTAIMLHSDRHDRHFCLMSFNVKTYGARMDFETLARTYQQANGPLTPAQLRAARIVHEQQETEATRTGYGLHYHAVEDTRTGLTDGDAYAMDPNGTPRPTVWEFHGRSGGYAVPVQVDGMNLTRWSYEEDARADLMDPDVWNFEDVRALYRLAVVWGHDLTPTNAAREVEYQAAYLLFENYAAEAMQRAETMPEEHAAPVLVLWGHETGGAYTREVYTVTVTPEESALLNDDQLSALIRNRATAAANRHHRASNPAPYAVTADEYDPTAAAREAQSVTA
ncbi:hypothetical protein IHN63_00005 [Deinococcus sp. 6YEL10]|uniref:hypothetical protein n=1 Tax=Deinococcus sp. 6YEL10 TaxID=2745870 RepID=UPI001E62BBEA|nr:hypothetical protein [Deinococcus sp. 6YEL10]MCD0159680.1 hypothetical protein [Deinococcus sp. 6YEL10]